MSVARRASWDKEMDTLDMLARGSISDTWLSTPAFYLANALMAFACVSGIVMLFAWVINAITKAIRK
jgi:hypothetical protein